MLSMSNSILDHKKTTTAILQDTGTATMTAKMIPIANVHHIVEKNHVESVAAHRRGAETMILEATAGTIEEIEIPGAKRMTVANEVVPEIDRPIIVVAVASNRNVSTTRKKTKATTSGDGAM